ncbi:hypothetical protein DNL40_15945 [Xylanimonas oleitrophica]|uniref:Uncharacterized protein n=1 Tax=Xylanimonas oleitrophica TaxID=2607479 RepID=A0A2W5Y215_9MICO|nr:LpqB family beta-propeller domain-containing protein [Xylanimonas oleitrophica]PZR51534.1 hypothetical protein DNL40_15945 [Xylanimonas oleitrophica]
MNPRGTLVAALTALVLLLSACASIPSTGKVREGRVDVEQGADVGQVAVGPASDAEPDAIVRGFLLAAQAGPTSSTPFSVAKEYLTQTAGTSWRPYARVVVLDGSPQLTVEPVDAEASTATVRASGRILASLDERGVYAEAPAPMPHEVTFELTRTGGQWRISSLDDGLMVPSQVFTSAYHYTRLYFPTPDLQSWVPDVRWFPQQTWRTNAVREVLAGPPEWLGGAVTSVLPEGTSLAIDAVAVGAAGTVEVTLTEQVADATSQELALFRAQLQATLSDSGGHSYRVDLLDATGPLAGSEGVSVPRAPRTLGPALAVRDGRLWRVEGRSLTAAEDLDVDLSGLDPTALATGPQTDPVVVRDGTARIVRVSGGRQTVLLEGPDLVAPSVDRYRAVWSGVPGGALQVVLPSGSRYPVTAPWLEDRTVTSLRVSPDGARLAVVTSGTSGTSVQVAGIVRDAQGVPTSLTDPVTVGASVHGVTQAVWQDEAVLGLLGDDDDGGRTLFLSGVGGLAGVGGAHSREVAGLTGPASVTASVGLATTLALDDDGVLYQRQSAALWPVLAEHVDLVAYPG